MNRRFLFVSSFVLWVACVPLGAQPQSTALQSTTADPAALTQLWNQLAATNAFNDADLIAIISERTVAVTAARMNGLEIKPANGALLRVTSVALELKNAAALVRLGVEAQQPTTATTTKLNLQLTGRLGSGEVNGSSLRLPFHLTDVSFGEAGAPPSFFQALLREWLSAARWNAALPPLELPLQLSQELEVPAARFNVEGQLPMEITTPAYRVKADFTLAAMLVLNGRVVVALRLPTSQPVTPQPSPTSTVQDVATLESEIERLSRSLTTEGGDVRLHVRRAALNTLLQQIAAAQSTDLTMLLKPARLRAEQVEGIFSTLNYTDVEAGSGRADVQSLTVEQIRNNRLDLRVQAQGEMNLRVRGREYGIPYSLAPHGTFEINREIVPLELTNESERLVLRAAPGSRVPINVRIGIELAGQQITIPRTVTAPADQWLKGVALPTLFDREIQLPRHIEANGGGQSQVTNSAGVRYTLSKLRATADQDVLEIKAEVSVGQ